MNKSTVFFLFLVLMVACIKDEAMYKEVKTAYVADTTLNVEVVPNPFDSVITISFALHKSESTTIQVSNVSGKIMYVLPYLHPISGNNQVALNLSQVASGVYFLKVTSGNRSTIKRIIKI